MSFEYGDHSLRACREDRERRPDVEDLFRA
jgi:hypothetical protein